MSGEALLQRFGGVGQVEGNRRRGRRFQHRVAATLAQVLQQNIAPERDAEGGKLGLWETSSDQVEHMRKVSRLARMIAAGESVGLARAAPKMHEQDPETGCAEGADHSARVAGVQIAVQSMQEQNDRALFGSAPAQIEEIAVGQIDPLPVQVRPTAKGDDEVGEGLEMAVLQEGMRTKMAAYDGHTGS